MSILKDNSHIGSYQVVGRIDDGRYNYREVYEAVRWDNEESPSQYALTVYDESLWSKAKGEKCAITEIDVCKAIDVGLPRMFDSGNLVTAEGKQLTWMCQQKVGMMPLAEYFKSVATREEETLVNLAKGILHATRDISKYLADGGHYNLHPGNIFVVEDDNATPHIVLTGLTHAGRQYHGKPPFRYTELQTNYLAPEAKMGIYDVLTDIYAIGRIIGTLITLKEDTLQDDFLDKMRGIVAKATARKRLERIRTMNEFIGLVCHHQEAQTPPPAPTPREQGGKKPKEQSQRDASMDTISPHSEQCNAHIALRQGKGFEAVAGFDSLKERLYRNIITVIQHKEMAKALGVVPTNSILLYGPPGCGKSFLAEHLAEEAGINYTLITPQTLASTLIHGSQQVIADLFRRLEKQAPVLVAFDEADAIAPNRAEDYAHHQAGEVNELLTQINNCAERGIYVLMMTNYPERIDPAILRSGRTDVRIFVPLPDNDTRKKIFELEMKERLHEEGIDFDKLSLMTKDFTSSDISYIVKEASRRDLYECAKANMESPLPISQQMLEDVIKQTTSSVTPEQIRHYERLRERMEGQRTHSRPIGFNINK